jgi:18S rRNA (guanine1575-N7)-methyltransferase
MVRDGANRPVRDGASRPEAVAPPEEFYSGKEAERYTSCKQTTRVQAELTTRALLFAGITRHLASRNPLVLDIGCGSGLSGDILSTEGVAWLGSDISSDMLALANSPAHCYMTRPCDRSNVEGGSGGESPGPSLGPGLGPCLGLLLSDMGQGLPLRPSLFDACISISAVQWLCVREDHREALHRFFTSLWRVMRPGALGVLQVRTGDREHNV